MKLDLKLVLFLISFGAITVYTLFAYAGNTFATKDTVMEMRGDIKEIRSLVIDIKKGI